MLLPYVAEKKYFTGFPAKKISKSYATCILSRKAEIPIGI